LTRATDDSWAINGELYRSTNDNQSLYYKDNGWDSIKLIDITTNKLNENLLPDSVLSPSLVLWENMTALDISTIWADGLLHKYLWASSSWTYSTGVYNSSCDYFMLDTNKVCLLYTSNRLSNYYNYMWVIGTITGSSISRWTPVEVWTTWNYGWNSSVIKWCKLATDKFAVAIQHIYYGWNQATDDVMSVVCTVAWSVITAGSAVGLKSANSVNSIQDIIRVATDKYVVQWQWNSAYNMMCCTVSWTTITKWWALTYGWASTRLCPVSDNIFRWTDGTTLYRFTISGSTITQWNSLALWATYTSHRSIYVSDTQQIFSGINTWTLYSIVINWTPTTPTKWSNYVMKSTITAFAGVCVLWSGLVYSTWASGSTEYLISAELASTVIYKNNELTISASMVVKNWLVSTGRYALWFMASNPTIPYSFCNNEYNAIVGFLNTTWTISQSISVSKKWDVLSWFTWLIPWYKYYINSAMAISSDSTTWVWYWKELGLALTSTKLLVTV
jgi:hypothetical protein